MQAVFQVAPAPSSSRFLCPHLPLLLSAPNQNRHATQAKENDSRQSDEIQATTVVDTEMENLKSYGERERVVYKLPHLYVQNGSEVELLH